MWTSCHVWPRAVSGLCQQEGCGETRPLHHGPELRTKINPCILHLVCDIVSLATKNGLRQAPISHHMQKPVQIVARGLSSIPLVIREMQTKPTVRCHYLATQKAEFRGRIKRERTKTGREVQKLAALCSGAAAWQNRLSVP